MPSWGRRRFLKSATGAISLRAAARRALGATAQDPLKIDRFVTHKARIGRQDYLFLEIRTDKGITGIGEGSLPNRVELVEAALQWLESHLAGLDPQGVEDHWDQMYYRLSRWRHGAVLMTAMAAVDIALWDLEGKRLGVPVHRLLGGPLKRDLPVYYSHWAAPIQPRTLAGFTERAQKSREEGWTTVKWVVPVGASDRDRTDRAISEMEATRKGGGPDFEIALELWERFSVRSAIEFARAVAPLKPLFLEEPTLRENPAGLAQVAEHSPVPIATGEGLLSRFDYRPLLEQKGAAIIQPDVIHCGGITEMKKIANQAETYGVELAPHQWYGPIAHVASLHVASVCRNFLVQEWDAIHEEQFVRMTGGTFPAQAKGTVRLPQDPGLGLTVDLDRFTRTFPWTPEKNRPSDR